MRTCYQLKSSFSLSLQGGALSMNCTTEAEGHGFIGCSLGAMYMCLYLCAHTFMYVCTCMYVYMYTHVCMHEHIYGGYIAGQLQLRGA